MDIVTQRNCALAWLFVALVICSPAAAQTGGHLRTVSTPVAVMSSRSIDAAVPFDGIENTDRLLGLDNTVR